MQNEWQIYLLQWIYQNDAKKLGLPIINRISIPPLQYTQIDRDIKRDKRREMIT